MASIGPSTIASSFERLLILPGGGGDSTNLIALTDGDAGTTFGLKLSTTDISVPATGKVYLDGGDSTYIAESSDGIIDFYANGKVVFKLNNSGETIISSDALRIGDEDNTSPAVVIKSHYEQPDSTTTVHVISPGGDNYGDDVLLLGRADSTTSTNVVLNAKVGIHTHSVYPTGPKSDFHICDTLATSHEDYGEFHLDYHAPSYGVGITTKATAGWDRSFGFLALSGDVTTDTRLGGFIGSGDGEALARLSIGVAYDNANGIHWDMTNSRCGIGTLTPDTVLEIEGTGDPALNVQIKATALTDTDVASFKVKGTGNSVENEAEIGIMYENGATTNAPTGFIKLDASNGTSYYLWVDDTGDLRVSSTSTHVGGTSGTVVGAQS